MCLTKFLETLLHLAKGGGVNQMTLYELRFGKIIAISAHIAEVIIDDEIEMDESMVDEYHQFLKSTFSAPILLLVNKMNRYTYTLAAQKKLAGIPEICAMSVVVYNRISELSTNALISIPRSIEWNIRVFHNRRQALEWLEQSQFLLANQSPGNSINGEGVATVYAASSRAG